MSETNERTQRDDVLYTIPEIQLATGMPRGTIQCRAKKLGFPLDGLGFTAQQVMAIITEPMQRHWKDEQMAMELREKLNQMIADYDLPIAFVEKEIGQWKMIRYDRKRA